MKKILLLHTIILFCIGLHAQQASQQKPLEQKHIISFELLGLRFSSPGINYEYRANERSSWFVGMTAIRLWKPKNLYGGFLLDWTPNNHQEGVFTDIESDIFGYGTIQGDESYLREGFLSPGIGLRIGNKWMFKRDNRFNGYYISTTLFYSHFKDIDEHEYIFYPYDSSLPEKFEKSYYSEESLNTAGLLISVGYRLKVFGWGVIDLNTGMGYGRNFDTSVRKVKDYNKEELESFENDVSNDGTDDFRFTHLTTGQDGFTGSIVLHVGLSFGVAF
ncbi:MAG: hypothetical protein KDD99_31410 [Bacteroidetes bacterium]|nr:hypothetical protein [Bacteroidota bacterium]